MNRMSKEHRLFRARFWFLMKLNNKTQSDVAQALKIPLYRLRDELLAKQNMPADRIKQIADALDVDPEFFNRGGGGGLDHVPRSEG